jgi:transcription initiation factor TFIIH subunit 4
VGAITKESLYGAFDNGITAEQVSSILYFYRTHYIATYSYAFVVFCQIIAFLQQNAHPRVIDKVPIVPENVTDQVSTTTYPSLTRHHLSIRYEI